jgi:hypothetical protein
VLRNLQLVLRDIYRSHECAQPCQGENDLVVSASEHTHTLARDAGKVLELRVAKN